MSLKYNESIIDIDAKLAVSTFLLNIKYRKKEKVRFKVKEIEREKNLRKKKQILFKKNF